MPASSFIIVAIDGGAASGKSSSSRALSEQFNLLHVDTGSFYRAITAELIRQGVAAADHVAVKGALAGLPLGTPGATNMLRIAYVGRGGLAGS